jgi:Leucine-rich repeat (LRR) protein
MHPGNIKNLSGVNVLKNIEEFEFSHQNLIEMPDLSSLKNIKKLHVEKCTNMKPIDYSKIPAGVESLILWNVNLKDLQGIERFVNLKELWIGDNPGLKTLSRLNDIKTLNELNVGLCSNLPSEEILKLNNIRTLIIAADQYPPQVIEALKKKGINVQFMT